MVVEDVFSLAKYPKSGITLGQVTGVVMLAGWQMGVSSVEIPVREAKQVLTGNGNASKMQLEESVRHRLKHQSSHKTLSRFGCHGSCPYWFLSLL